MVHQRLVHLPRRKAAVERKVGEQDYFDGTDAHRKSYLLCEHEGKQQTIKLWEENALVLNPFCVLVTAKEV